MLDPRLRVMLAGIESLIADPVGTARQLLPNCDVCTSATIAACSRCQTAICHLHGYICIGARDAICIPCIEELRHVDAD